MTYARYAAPAKSLCIYCGKQVHDYDPETGQPCSYGSTCMFDHKDGRYAVIQTDPKDGARVIRRFANMKRAEDVADWYRRGNAHCVWATEYKWHALDLGAGFTYSCDQDA